MPRALARFPDINPLIVLEESPADCSPEIAGHAVEVSCLGKREPHAPTPPYISGMACVKREGCGRVNEGIACWAFWQPAMLLCAPRML